MGMWNKTSWDLHLTVLFFVNSTFLRHTEGSGWITGTETGNGNASHRLQCFKLISVHLRYKEQGEEKSPVLPRYLSKVIPLYFKASVQGNTYKGMWASKNLEHKVFSNLNMSWLIEEMFCLVFLPGFLQGIKYLPCRDSAENVLTRIPWVFYMHGVIFEGEFLCVWGQYLRFWWRYMNKDMSIGNPHLTISTLTAINVDCRAHNYSTYTNILLLVYIPSRQDDADTPGLEGWKWMCSCDKSPFHINFGYLKEGTFSFDS